MTAQPHTAPAPARRLMTTHEVAAELGVHEKTVGDYIRGGELSYVQFGRQRRVTPAQLDEFIENHTVPATVAPAARQEDAEPAVEADDSPAEPAGSGVTFLSDGLTGRSRAARGRA